MKEQIRSCRAFFSTAQKHLLVETCKKRKCLLRNRSLFFCTRQTRKSALAELTFLLRRNICSLKHARKENACYAAAPFFEMEQTRKSALAELSFLLRRNICSLKHARKGNVCCAAAPFSFALDRLANPLLQSFFFCCAEIFAR